MDWSNGVRAKCKTLKITPPPPSLFFFKHKNAAACKARRKYSYEGIVNPWSLAVDQRPWDLPGLKWPSFHGGGWTEGWWDFPNSFN